MFQPILSACFWVQQMLLIRASQICSVLFCFLISDETKMVQTLPLKFSSSTDNWYSLGSLMIYDVVVVGVLL